VKEQEVEKKSKEESKSGQQKPIIVDDYGTEVIKKKKVGK
jgi:hypothetical protein